MNREQFEHVASLFERSRALDRRGREMLFANAEVSDQILEQVRALLSHHDDDSGVLTDTQSDPRSQEANHGLPRYIDQYRVKRRLGAGGMGVVYLAEQSHPHRDVAIKVIRRALVSSSLLKRFEYEAAVLGRLQHPGIAQIYEAGSFDDGVGPMPFFAMEYIDGVSLLQHVEAERTGVRDRLALFSRVCDAVHHAHQRGVIHRDLKPGNILVDREGAPKVLDFGIARATDADLQLSSIHTEPGRLLGTVAYMSPEQVAGKSSEVDTRSDVYALGAVLYELLSGKSPYDLPDEMIAAARVIREQEPASLTGIDKGFRGDLDTIVQTALAKEPTRRYQSAYDLKEDIRRFLSDEPILARPATTLYQLSRFARRNRAVVAGAAATLTVLVAGIAVATTYAVGQTRALAESVRQQRISDAVHAFLTEDLINQANPEVEADRNLTLGEALDNASGRIEGRFKDAPLVEASLRLTIGQTYRGLARIDEAEAHLRRALELNAAELGDEHEETLLCRMELAVILSERADHAGAESALRELLPLQQRVLGPDHVQTIATINNLGAALMGQGRYAEAEPLIREALASRERLLGVKNEHTATTMNNLAVLYVYNARFEEAAELLPRVIDTLIEVKGESHPQTLQSTANLGVVYSRLGRMEESIDTLEGALEKHRSALGPTHRSTLGLASSLASMYGRMGKSDRQHTLLSETLEAQRSELGEDHFDTLVTRMNLAKVHFDKGNIELALSEYTHLADRFDVIYPDHFFSSIVRSMIGRCLVQEQEYAEAEGVLLTAHAHISKTLGEFHRDTVTIASQIAELYQAWGNETSAAEWMRRADQDRDDP